MRLALLFFICCPLPFLKAQSSSDKGLIRLISQYESHINQFKPIPLRTDFKLNLTSELSENRLNEQKAFYQELEKQLRSLEKNALSKDLKIDYEILLYEALLNQERLLLIEQTTSHPSINSLDKIYDHDNGAKWYAWFIKKWTGTLISPQEAMDFGREEVARVKNEILKLKLPKKKTDDWYTHDLNKILKTLEHKKGLIQSQLPRIMPDFQVPKLNIAQGKNSNLAQTPAYYMVNTFFFNLFEKPFDLADCDWLLIHEGNPGHHFQVNYHNELKVKPYRQSLRYMGFVEGWAAYTETLGTEMGLYESSWEVLGKWNWDMIRSVRIVLDVGLNFHGWPDEKAMTYWKQHIQGQDDIAVREINRMKRWPAQVLTYKMGEAAILKALKKEKRAKGTSFSYKEFHTMILSKGIIPVHLISELTEMIP